MATVTGFESLRHPRRTDMKQFAELFLPVFLSSSANARRQAAAALSQCPVIPAEVAYLIGTQPIGIAAIFLTRSQAIGEQTLISIIRATGEAHAQAIAYRADLSPMVVDVLVERRRVPDTARRSPAVDPREEARLEAEEQLRLELKALVREQEAPRTPTPKPSNTPTLKTPVPDCPDAADDIHTALMIRFARMGETALFASTLASALGSSRDLAARILSDTSGQQLAATLTTLALPAPDIATILKALYPHLGARATTLVQAVPADESATRIAAWLRADSDDTTEIAANHNEPAVPEEPEPVYGYGFRQGMRA